MSKPLIQYLQEDLENVIKKYYDQGITLGECIGVLEIVKLRVWSISAEDSFDDISLGDEL